MSAYELLIKQLAAAGISSPRLEARLLLGNVLNCSADDMTSVTAELNTEQQKKLEEVINRRIIRHEPLDKILGHKEFYKYDFLVNENVLSPRPETEILLEEALRLSKIKTTAGNNALSVLDLGTGSGCILLSLLKENPSAHGIGVDISAAALETARKNAEQLGIEQRVKWINADWFDDNFTDYFETPFDLIVSNPPYIPEADIAGLDDEVRLYDPHWALSGGTDGYDSYHRLAEVIPNLLADGGYVLLECGQGQTARTAEIFMHNHLSLCGILKDLAGIDRCVILKK